MVTAMNFVYQMSEQTCELVGGDGAPRTAVQTFVCTALAVLYADLSAFSGSAAECNLAGGQYMGDGSSAEDYELGACVLLRPGACCLGSGGCTVLTLVSATSWEGSIWGTPPVNPATSTPSATA